MLDRPPLAEILGTQANVLWVMGGVLVAMAIGTVVRLSTLGDDKAIRQRRLASLKTWWCIVLLVGTALLLGRTGVVIMFAFVSMLALREYLSLTHVDARQWHLAGWTYAIVLLNYLWVGLGWKTIFLVFVPLATPMLTATRMVMRERSEGFLITESKLLLGMMLTVYCLSHAPLLLSLPPSANPVAGNAGWLLYLLLLTEWNDISQALIGRRFGRIPIAPVLSPHKTWEGFVGGTIATLIAAVSLAPILTPLSGAAFRLGEIKMSIPLIPAGVIGLLISVSGYFGDLTISGFKRDLGVKDSGTLMPGQGGILDRIDSLMFAAPLYYYHVCLVIGATSQYE